MGEWIGPLTVDRVEGKLVNVHRETDSELKQFNIATINPYLTTEQASKAFFFAFIYCIHNLVSNSTDDSIHSKDEDMYFPDGIDILLTESTMVPSVFTGLKSSPLLCASSFFSSPGNAPIVQYQRTSSSNGTTRTTINEQPQIFLASSSSASIFAVPGTFFIAAAAAFLDEECLALILISTCPPSTTC